MLLELRVQNLGIIEDMSLSLDDGLNVITGETGAGKSLVIDALEILLGGKASGDDIRHGADAAQIEGVFAVTQEEKFSALRTLLAQKDLAADDDTLVIDCQLRRQKPGVIRLNGHVTPKTLVRQIGGLLVDIHAQSEHLSLLDSDTHLAFLDAYARTLELRNSFSIKAAERNRIKQEMAALEKDEQDSVRRADYLRFQVEEIGRAKLREDEEEELEAERHILAATEQLKVISQEAYRALYEDASRQSEPAVDRLNEAVQAMKKLVEIDPALQQQLNFLNETVYGLTEAARDISTYSDSLVYDPGRLEEVESRLEIMRGLKRKYGHTIRDVLDFMAKAEKELAGMQHSAERRMQLGEVSRILREEMGEIASRLSVARTKAARQLEIEVKKELADLNMSQVEFEVRLGQQPDRDGIIFPDGESYAYSNEGADNVAFMVATNPGEPKKPLAGIASTGEISRFMLALKSVLSEAYRIPLLVFDEIDIGIGGRSGEIIGRKLRGLAQNHQVVCITHLPQIAAFADTHFSVHKEVSGTRTLSILQKLDGEARVKELAVMLAGNRHTDTALRNARELMQQATAWGKSHRRAIGETPAKTA
ncbi:MAG: DNA repair protein RecN [Chloroflexota bacterium]